MRRAIVISLLLWAALTAAQAQTQYTVSVSEQLPVSDQFFRLIPNAHYVELTWTDPGNPQGTAYNLYRSLADCSRVSRFVVVATVTALGYVDRSVSAATYCYSLTAVYQGQESAPSATAVAVGLDVRDKAKAVQIQ